MLVDDSLLSVSTSSAGDAGTIHVESPKVTFQNGPGVFDFTISIAEVDVYHPDVPGAPGRIDIRAGSVTLENGADVNVNCINCAPDAVDSAHIGVLVMHVTGALELLRGGRIIASTVNGAGNAGSVEIHAGSVSIRGSLGRINKSGIFVNSEGSTGDAGSLLLDVTGSLELLGGGVILADTRGEGAGGSITIDPELVILQNGSRIVADAGAGSGGNIQITADNYFAFPGSVVDASSDLGIDGIVEVSTPDVDLAGTLTALPASYLDAASVMRERCAARRSGKRAGSFAVRGNGGIPAEPDGWLPATVSFEAAPGLAPTAMRAAVLGGAALFALGSCR